MTDDKRSPLHEALYELAKETDRLYTELLESCYGPDAGDMRYASDAERVSEWGADDAAMEALKGLRKAFQASTESLWACSPSRYTRGAVEAHSRGWESLRD